MTDRLRLALFTDSLHPSGVGRVMELLARHLPVSHYELFLICADHEGADELAERMRPYVSDTFRCTVRWDDDVAALPTLVARLQAWKIEFFIIISARRGRAIGEPLPRAAPTFRSSSPPIISLRTATGARTAPPSARQPPAGQAVCRVGERTAVVGGMRFD